MGRPWLNMKNRFPQRNKTLPKVIGVVLVLLVILFALKAGDSEGFRDKTRGWFSPLYGTSLFLKNSLGSFSGFFASKSSLSAKVQSLEDEVAGLKFEKSSLEARIHDLESLTGIAPQSKPNTTSALISSQAPSMPYDTLRVSWNGEKKISPGIRVLAYGSSLVGEVAEAGDKTALVKLISYPGFETDAWISRISLNVTLVGEGGYNMKFTLPKSIQINVGDQVFSNTNPQFLIGEVSRVVEKSSEPLQDVILRFPFNFRNLRYVEFLN